MRKQSYNVRAMDDTLLEVNRDSAILTTSVQQTNSIYVEEIKGTFVISIAKCFPLLHHIRAKNCTHCQTLFIVYGGNSAEITTPTVQWQVNNTSYNLQQKY